MSARAQTVRLSPSQYRVLADFAKRRGLSEYAMLARVVEAGFLAMLHDTDKETDLAELAREIGAISERLAEAERVLDRTLFTACAAYCYARSAAMGGGKTDEVLAAEINRAYDRQRAAMAERS